MRTEPGPLTCKCIACGVAMSAVRFCYHALVPKCEVCGMTPADAYLSKHGEKTPPPA